MFKMHSEILVLKNTIFLVQNTNFWMSKYKFLCFKVGRSAYTCSLDDRYNRLYMEKFQTWLIPKGLNRVFPGL